jgi:hypothetical protein
LNTNYMKAPNANPKNKLFITLLTIATLLFGTLGAKAQEQDDLPFPFKGGNTAMTAFFRDSLTVSPDIIQKKATGTVVMKFTADALGKISRVIIYYADDYTLTQPVIEALKKSSHQWVIPPHEKLHDFILPFTIYFNLPVNPSPQLTSDFYKFYTQRHQILSLNQVPINTATLLPTVVVTYDVQ